MPPTGPRSSSELAVGPDALEAEAYEHLRLLAGEHLRRVYRTVRGFLVVTNLRCAEVSRLPRIFGASEWHSGPNLFFYDLAAPRVILGRYLRLSEENGTNAFAVRFLDHDPAAVAREVMAARTEGRTEWLQRKAAAERSVREAQERWAARSRSFSGGRPAPQVRCNFCGNMMDATARRCPSCGAPPG